MALELAQGVDRVCPLDKGGGIKDLGRLGGILLKRLNALGLEDAALLGRRTKTRACELVVGTCD